MRCCRSSTEARARHSAARMFHRTLFCLVFWLALTPVAYSQRNAQADTDCFTGSQANARACLTERLHESESALAKAEQATLVALNRWDETPSNRTRATVAFKKSMAQFRRYRLEQCELQAALAAGGTGTTHRRLLCAIELNQRQMDDMASVIERVQ
jgi:hypothetical protein